MSMKYKLNALLKHPGYNGGGGGSYTPAPKYAPGFSGPSVMAAPTAPTAPQYNAPTNYGSNLAGMSQYSYNPYGSYGSPFGGYGSPFGGYGSPFGTSQPQYQAQYQPQSQPQGPVGRGAAYEAAMASGDPRQIHMAMLMKGASSSQPQPQSQPQGPVGSLQGDTVRLSDLQYQPQPMYSPYQQLNQQSQAYNQLGPQMQDFSRARVGYNKDYAAYKNEVNAYNQAAQNYRNTYGSGYSGYSAPTNMTAQPMQTYGGAAYTPPPSPSQAEMQGYGTQILKDAFFGKGAR